MNCFISWPFNGTEYFFFRSDNHKLQVVPSACRAVDEICDWKVKELSGSHYASHGVSQDRKWKNHKFCQTAKISHIILKSNQLCCSRISWRGNTAGHNPYRCTHRWQHSDTDDLEVDMPLTNKKELAEDVNISDSLDSSEMLEFKIPREGNKTKPRITILDFMRKGFGLSRNLLERITCDIIMRKKWDPEELTDFKFYIGAHVKVPHFIGIQ